MDIVNPYIRKLTTSETLEHATRALETHREWMRRRTQNTVTPGPAASSENGASDKGKSKTASWAVKNPHSDDAPPPFDTARDISGRRKISLGKGRNEEKQSSESKKLLSHRTRIAPAPISRLDASHHNGVSLPPAIRPTSPGIFLSQREEEHQTTSSQLSPTKKMAWGSFSSLDDQIETLSSPDNKMEHVDLKRRNIDFTDNSTKDYGTTNDSSLDQSINSNDRPFSRSTSEQNSLLPSPRSDISHSESEVNEESIQSLQQASSAMIVAVSPAPRDQRTSYASQKAPKVASVEIREEFNKHEGDTSKEHGAISPSSLQYMQSFSLGRTELCQDIPEADIKHILPQFKEVKNGISVSAKGIQGSSLASDENISKDKMRGRLIHENIVQESDKLLEEEQLQMQTQALTNGVVSLAKDITVKKKRRKRKHISSIVKEVQTQNGGGLISDKPPAHSTSFKDGSTTVSHASALSSGRSQVSDKSSGNSSEPRIESSTPAYSSAIQFAQSSTTSRIGHDKEDVLKGIDLPPLRKMELTDIYLDGTQLVKTLPPLKLVSPYLAEDVSQSGKRARKPPDYDIHHPRGGGMTLSPPCPVYGAEQPEEEEDKVSGEDTEHPVRLKFHGTSAMADGNIEMKLRAKMSKIPEVTRVASAETLEPVKPVSSLPTDHSSLQKVVTVGSTVQQSDGIKGRDYETSQEIAFRLNQTSSTLVLNDPTPGVQSRTQDEGTAFMSPSDNNVVMATDSLVFSSSANSLSLAELPHGPGPLHLAAKSGNLRAVQSLLDQGYEVDAPDHDGKPPLMYCILKDGVSLSCADALIKNGANLNKQCSDGSTVMHLAASIGAVSVLELLLLNGARADVQDFEGRQPLHWATLQKGTKIFSLLLKRSNVHLDCTDDAGMTVLMWAAYNDNPNIVSYLLDQGADPEEKDKDGYTAMHWSVHKMNSHCLQLLLKPDMTYFKDHRGRTVMHMAAETGSMAACEVILKLRPDAIHDTDKKGHTPLHYAAVYSRVDVCALLLDYGADATQKDSTLKTPLDYARDKKLDYVVALLSCHENAVADFARASRSVSLSSLLNRSVSFSQLPLTDASANLNETPDSLSLTKSATSFTESSVLSAGWSGGEGGFDQGVLNVAEGGYLGLFFPGDREAVRHYYFRLNKEEGAIYWSRSQSNSFRNPSKALVLEVHEGPSNTVKQVPSFSQSDLHCYTFWVLTGGGVLDLFAYNEDAFKTWLIELERIAQKNANLIASGVLQKFQSTSVHSRPQSSLSLNMISKSSVSPMTDGECASHTASNSLDHAEPKRVKTAIFTSPGDGISSDETSQQVSEKSSRVSTFKKNTRVVPEILNSESSAELKHSSKRQSHANFIGDSFRSHDQYPERSINTDDNII